MNEQAHTNTARRGGCKRCQALPAGFCSACKTRLRRRAITLRDKDKLTVEKIAERLAVTVAQAARLIEEADQLRDLEQYKCDAIPVAPIREMFKRRLQEDPTLTQTQLAAAIQTDRVELLRTLGLQPTASRIVKGKRRPGKLRTEISVEMAGRIIKALGIAPHEVPWL